MFDIIIDNISPQHDIDSTLRRVYISFHIDTSLGILDGSIYLDPAQWDDIGHDHVSIVAYIRNTLLSDMEGLN